jgi:hypothetical protein
LLLAALAAVAAIGAEPNRTISASIGFGEEKLGLDFSIKGAGQSVGAGFCADVTGMAAERPYVEFESEPCAAYFGIGHFQDSRALRSQPASQPKSEAGAMWTRGISSGEALSVFGIASSKVGFVVIADAAGEISAEIADRFRFCGVEAGAGIGDRCRLDGGVSLAAKPGAGSGEGWRSGAAWEPATSVISAAAAARYAAWSGEPSFEPSTVADAWFACEAGSLAEPGAAMVLRLSAGWRVGLLSGASLGIFAASRRFLTVLGEPPPRDFSADLRTDFNVGGWRFSMGAMAASLQSDGSGRLEKSEGVSALDRILWQWRVDMAALTIEASSGGFSFRARGTADSGGLKDGAMALRLAPKRRGDARDGGASGGAFREVAPRRLRPVFSGGAAARFSRAPAAADDDAEEDEDLWDDEDDEYAAVETGMASLALRSLKGELSADWEPGAPGVIGDGGAKLAVAARRGDDSWTIALSGALFQSIRFGRGIALKFGIQTPAGGYVLNEAPESLPRFSLDIGITRR